MNLYEVKVPLESSLTLNLMVAAPNKGAAISDALKVLRDVAEPKSIGDVCRYRWLLDEITADEIALMPPPMSDAAADREVKRAEEVFERVNAQFGKIAALRAVLTLAHVRAGS